MARKFAEIKKTGRADPQAQAQTAAERRAIEDVRTLAALREARGLTQEQLAEALAVSQSNVARIEHREDHYLSTLRVCLRSHRRANRTSMRWIIAT